MRRGVAANFMKSAFQRLYANVFLAAAINMLAIHVLWIASSHFYFTRCVRLWPLMDSAVSHGSYVCRGSLSLVTYTTDTFGNVLLSAAVALMTRFSARTEVPAAKS